MEYENIIVATDDPCFFRKVSASIEKTNRKCLQISTVRELVSEIKSSGAVLVVYDVYFLSDKAKVFVSAFKQLNGDSRHLMCVLGTNKTVFALRLKAIGFDGVIENIRDTRNFESCLGKFLSNNSYFTPEVERELSFGQHLNRKPQTTEITLTDELTFMLTLEGLSPQEIDPEHPKNVSNRIHALVEKCGVENLFELERLLGLY